MKIAVLTHNPIKKPKVRNILEKEGSIIWSKSLNLEKNQIILIYISKGIRKIQYIVKVENIFDDSYKLKLVTKIRSDISKRLTYEKLKENGLKEKTINYYLDSNNSLYEYVTNILCEELIKIETNKKPCFYNNTEELSDAESEKLKEGAKRKVTVNAYERNFIARKKCINKYGFNCFICGFNFQKTYGEIGKEFIHVHHLKPLSEIQEEYEVNPIEDLRPVCPNCHAMLHRKIPAYSIDEIKDILK